MDKYYKTLYCLNKEQINSQRALSQMLNISVGQANYLLKYLEAEEYIDTNKPGYTLTLKGEHALERMTREKQDQKLKFQDDSQQPIKMAVILAAGENKAFEKPVGLLPIDGLPLLERIIRDLQSQGIEQFVVVIGAGADQYRSYFGKRKINLLYNDRYKWTGTMASLVCAADAIHEDFLLVEVNQLLESSGYERMLSSPIRNSMLLTSPSGSEDEAYVELDDEGQIFRISKDIRQMNRIDAELLGVSRISMELFSKMLNYYKKNENPYLNYEYVIENIGRLYQIHGIMIDDLVWALVENRDMYQHAQQIVYPRIKKRERLKKENQARAVLIKDLNVTDEQITKIEIAGGMTNTNFKVAIQNQEFILRIPGSCTETMINRKAEYDHSIRAAKAGFHPPIRYFNQETGIKFTEYIKGAQTLNGKSARLESNIQRTSSLLRRLHKSKIRMETEFDVWAEYQVYKKLVNEQGGHWYPGFREIEPFFYRLESDLEKLGRDRCPCHNDLVPENFVKDEQGRMFLIDWEYAGYHDPLWDVASHLLESGFEGAGEELYLKYYFKGVPDAIQLQKVALFKICQDILWSVWTIAKEAAGEDFGAYGQERFARAVKKRKEYEVKYGTEKGK